MFVIYSNFGFTQQVTGPFESEELAKNYIREKHGSYDSFHKIFEVQEPLSQTIDARLIAERLLPHLTASFANDPDSNWMSYHWANAKRPYGENKVRWARVLYLSQHILSDRFRFGSSKDLPEDLRQLLQTADSMVGEWCGAEEFGQKKIKQYWDSL